MNQNEASKGGNPDTSFVASCGKCVYACDLNELRTMWTHAHKVTYEGLPHLLRITDFFVVSYTRIVLSTVQS